MTDPDNDWGEWLRPFATMADDIDLSDEYNMRKTEDTDSVTVTCPAGSLRRLRAMFEVLGPRNETSRGSQCMMLSANAGAQDADAYFRVMNEIEKASGIPDCSLEMAKGIIRRFVPKHRSS